MQSFVSYILFLYVFSSWNSCNTVVFRKVVEMPNVSLRFCCFCVPLFPLGEKRWFNCKGWCLHGPEHATLVLFGEGAKSLKNLMVDFLLFVWFCALKRLYWYSFQQSTYSPALRCVHKHDSGVWIKSSFMVFHKCVLWNFPHLKKKKERRWSTCVASDRTDAKKSF